MDIKILSKLLVVLFFIANSLLYSGSTGKIVGKVVDAETGEALIGVNVIVMGTNRGAATDIDGFYQIINIPPGVYNIKFSQLLCTQVITYAKNPTTNHWLAFPNPCEVPEGWETSAEKPDNLLEVGVATQQLTQESIQNLSNGWNLLGTGTNIDDLSIFNSAKILWKWDGDAKKMGGLLSRSHISKSHKLKLSNR